MCHLLTGFLLITESNFLGILTHTYYIYNADLHTFISQGLQKIKPKSECVFNSIVFISIFGSLC